MHNDISKIFHTKGNKRSSELENRKYIKKKQNNENLVSTSEK